MVAPGTDTEHARYLLGVLSEDAADSRLVSWLALDGDATRQFLFQKDATCNCERLSQQHRQPAPITMTSVSINPYHPRYEDQVKAYHVDDEEDECLSEEEESECTDDGTESDEEEEPAPVPEAVDVVAEEEEFKKAFRNCLDAMNRQGLQDQNLPKPTNATLDPTARLGWLLKLWNQQFGDIPYLVYPLSHQYTEASLSLKNLKGQDGDKCRVLEQLCAENGAYCFLAPFKKMKEGDYDVHGISLGKTSTPLGSVISLNMDEAYWEEILADLDNFYKSRGADVENPADYTGNENTPSSERYHDTALIMMQKYCALDQFEELDHDTTSLMAMLELVRDDSHCDSYYLQKAIRILLPKSMEMIIYEGSAEDGGSCSKDRLLGYGPECERKRTEYREVFEAVADFCYANSLGDVVTDVLRFAISYESGELSVDVASLVARYTAKELACSQGILWSNWQVSIPDDCKSYANINKALRASTTRADIHICDGAK